MLRKVAKRVFSIEYMEKHNITNEKGTKHKQYECPCCKRMIGLHNKARHERTKRHKDNLITVKEETKTEKPKTETETEEQFKC